MDSPFFRSQGTQPSGQCQRTTPSPKVVSIPVHFVVSETIRSSSAVKIQKVFRGFLVRKTVKKIASISREVEAMERTISNTETVESIRRDSKERLRVSETLMAHLLKLDSIPGVDSGVRDYRKAVIKKAIALQERVDGIVTGNQTLETSTMTEHDGMDCTEETCEVKEIVEESVGDAREEDGEKAKEDERDCCVGEGKRNTELLERMMEDNEKMMRLMTQLCEKNEMQTRMLSSLTQRIEQLERAFVCDRMRRKKKRQAVVESTLDQNKCGKI